MKNIELINASAGSGKTHSLTTKIVDLIKNGIDPESLMVTTFTNRAASELHERIRIHLLKELWTYGVNRISDGYIGTVNSICARLLQEYAIEAGMSPAIQVMPEEESDSIFKVSIDRVIGLYAERMEAAARRLELDGNGSGYQENGEWRSDVKRIVDMARSNQISPDGLKVFAENSWNSLSALFGDPLITGMDKDLLDVINRAIDDLTKLGSTKKTTQEAMETLKSCCKRLQNKRLPWSDWVRLSKLKSAKDGQDYINPVKAIADNVLTQPLFHEDVKQIIAGVFGCAGDALRDYDLYKKEHGLMDFTDQETRVLDMAINNDAFKSSLSGRIQMLMVDEFQDTSPIQLALFFALTELAGKSVWVGDPKQAIYAFRGTDPQLMNDIVSLIGNAGVLNYSWRSKKNLLDFTNALFTEVFHEMGSDKVTLRVPQEREDKAIGGCLEVWHLSAKNNAEEALAIANGIRDLVERIPGVKPGDIAILCRKNDTCKEIATCLEALGVRASVGQGLLMDTRECILATAALRYMNNQADTIALAEIIRLTTCDNNWYSNLMTDSELTKENWHNTEIAKALNEARISIKFWTPLEALEQAINRVGLLPVLKSWRNSELALSNLDALRSACNKYIDLCSSRRRAATIDGFVTYLNESETEQAKGTGAQTVNVLTYHGSKGLEWPWVVLTGLDSKPKENIFGINIEAAQKFDPTDPLADRKIRYWPWPFGMQRKYDPLDIKVDALPFKRHILDKAEREEQRLLYVGMTRAKEGLVLALRKSTDGSSLKSAWLDILKDARGEQIVKMSTDISDRSIQIGRARIPFDIYGYCTEKAGLPGLNSDASEFLPSYTDTLKEYPNARVSPSELPYNPDNAGKDELKIVEVFGQRIKIKGSPEMVVMGNAVHSYFAVDYECLAADDQTSLARDILKNWSMESSIDPTDILDAGQRLATFIDRSYEGYKAYREWPISMRNEEGQIVQGWIDLLLDTPAGYVIIDHKDYPGKDVLDRMKKYVPQLRTYKEIVEKATGRPVIDMLLHLPISGLILRLLP